MPLGTRVAPFSQAVRSPREANTNQPTVSHFFTRCATVRHRGPQGQGKSMHFFNRFKDLARCSKVKFSGRKALRNKQIHGAVKVKCHERLRKTQARPPKSNPQCHANGMKDRRARMPAVVPAGAPSNDLHSREIGTRGPEGARQILMEQFAEEPELVGALRAHLEQHGVVVSTLVEGKEEAGAKFRDYFAYSEAYGKVAPHRALALFRGRVAAATPRGRHSPLGGLRHHADLRPGQCRHQPRSYRSDRARIGRTKRLVQKAAAHSWCLLRLSRRAGPSAVRGAGR